MASRLDLRHKALTVVVTIVAILVWGSDVRAQGKKTANSNTTTGNASWDQAISVLQAEIDQQAATIAQLQAALAGETTARQQADTTLQNNVNSEVIARQAAGFIAKHVAIEFPKCGRRHRLSTEIQRGDAREAFRQ